MIEQEIIWHGPTAIESPMLERAPATKQAPPWKVQVFDNETNTYDEVMTVLMLGTGCSSEEAYIEAWEIDHYGSCVVHRSAEDECRKAAEIIGVIGIRVEVSPEP